MLLLLLLGRLLRLLLLLRRHLGAAVIARGGLVTAIVSPRAAGASRVGIALPLLHDCWQEAKALRAAAAWWFGRSRCETGRLSSGRVKTKLAGLGCRGEEGPAQRRPKKRASDEARSPVASQSWVAGGLSLTR